MKIRRINPLSHLLRTFSTVVRFGGISRAAVDLHLTQGAVTKQIQELERWLEVALFNRNGKKLELTVAGSRYEKGIRPLLDQLEEATLGLISQSIHGGALNISAMPTFSTKWLIPRLPDFYSHHPDIQINFVRYVSGFDYRDSSIDGSILFGDGKWPGAESMYLDGLEVVLVAPLLTADSIREPHDVQRFPLLRHVTVPQHWPVWAEMNQLPSLNTLTGPQFDNYHSMIQAVISGLGVALLPRCLVADELASGVLAAPLAGQPAGGYTGALGYWFCSEKDRGRTVALTAFTHWLSGQVDY